MGRAQAATLAVVLAGLSAAGCFGPGYEAGWRIVDRDRDCSECEEVVYRTSGLDAAWSGRVATGHDLWGTYADPNSDATRILANWTAPASTQAMIIEFGGRVFTCGFAGGNVTSESGSFRGVRVAGHSEWHATITPGQGYCRADLDWGDGWSGTIVSWFVPDGRDGAGEAFDVAFTVQAVGPAPTAQDS